MSLGKQKRMSSRYIRHRCGGHLFSLKTKAIAKTLAKAAGHQVILWVAKKMVTKYLQ